MAKIIVAESAQMGQLIEINDGKLLKHICKIKEINKKIIQPLIENILETGIHPGTGNHDGKFAQKHEPFLKFDKKLNFNEKLKMRKKSTKKSFFKFKISIRWNGVHRHVTL